MIDVQAGLIAISSARDFASYIIGKKIDAAVTEKAVELMGHIISLQGLIFSLRDHNSLILEEKKNLENKLMQMEKWDATAAQYHLKEVVPGLFVYSYKGKVDESTPAHWICPNCYELKKKSILQRKTQDYQCTMYECPACRTQYRDEVNRLDLAL